MEPSIITRIITPLAIALIMFGMGLSLTMDDFKRVWRRPREVSIGVVLQIIGLPVLGLAFVLVLDLNPVLAASVMILSACPGGAITNLVSYMSKGDVALSVSLTAVNSLITVVTIPFIVTLSLGYFMGQEAAGQVAAMNLSLGIILITVPPIALGMAARVKFPGPAKRAENGVKKWTLVFLAFLASYALYMERETLMLNYKELALIASGLCFLSFLMGALVSRLFRLARKHILTLAIEVGLHNSAMGIVIAVSFLEINSLAVFSAFYLIIEYLFSGVVMAVCNTSAVTRLVAAGAFKGDLMKRG